MMMGVPNRNGKIPINGVSEGYTVKTINHCLNSLCSVSKTNTLTPQNSKTKTTKSLK